MTTLYDPENIFAKILKGDVPSHSVYEDENTFAFMDVMPQAPGHVLVVPKAASRNLLDADPAVLATVIPVVQKIARAVKQAFEAQGIFIAQFNEAAAGQTVFHLHFHIIPRNEDTPLQPHSGKMEESSVLAANAQKIRSALADQAPSQ